MDKNDFKGSWALIAGASSGIGKEFASQLAGCGFNLVLVARREDLLNELSINLCAQYPIQTIVIKADLTLQDSVSKIKILLKDKGIRIRLLCNNAAFGHYGKFEELDTCDYEKMVRLNIEAVVALSRIFLDDLLSFPTSVMINVSSQACFQPMPYMACYAASKAFISHFSLALYGEFKNRGLLVQTLIPKPTATEFDSRAGAPQFLKERGSAHDIVKISLNHLTSKAPIVTNASGILLQKILPAMLPAEFFLKQTSKKMIRDQDGEKLKNTLTVTTQIEINACASDVFDCLMDFGHYPQWNPIIPFISGEGKIGSKIKVRITPPGLLASNYVLKILNVNRPEEFRWLGHFIFPGIMDGDHAFIVKPLSSTTCLLIQTETFKGLLVPYLAYFLNRNMRQGFDQMNASVKQRVETSKK